VSCYRIRPEVFSPEAAPWRFHVTRPARLGEWLMGFSMMSTWLLALSVLLIALMGGVDLAVTLLSDLVRVFPWLLPH
jgi:hypothetical protein